MSTITARSITQELQTSFLDYAGYVIEDRALPDARDGLKPVQRRILYAAEELGLTPVKPHKKSARVVGDTIGKYHPHGDTAVYEAMVRMAQDFSLRYPLMEGHGNFGSVDGDAPAAMRYTEVRMSPWGMEMLHQLRKVGDWRANYDASLQEPTVLPSRIPNLLVNGAAGIAVGLSTNLVPHNLTEVLQGLIALLKDERVDVTQYILGPDFPTGGVLVNPEEWKSLAETGKGKLRLRATVRYETHAHRTRLVFTEIPYGQKLATILEKIAQEAMSGNIQGIEDLRNESGRGEVRIVVEVEDKVDPNEVLAQLYARTPLEVQIPVQNHVLVDGKPQILGLKGLMQVFTHHRREMLQRELTADWQVEERQAHLLDGFLRALQHIEKVLQTIRTSSQRTVAQERLVQDFHFSVIQAEAILNMPFRRLTGADQAEIQRQWEATQTRIRDLKDQLNHLDRTLLREWETLLRETKDPRRTKILATTPSVVSKKPHPTSCTVILNKGIVTKISGASSQGRVVSSEDALLFVFPDRRVKTLPVSRIPTRRGKTRGHRLPADPVWWGASTEEKPLTVITKEGKGKRVIAKGGTKPTTLSIVGDFLLDTEGKECLIFTKQGRVMRFNPEAELPIQGKEASGVKVMTLAPKDTIAFVLAVQPTTTLLFASSNGYTRSLAAQEVPLTKRGGKGIQSLLPTYCKGGTIQKVTPTK